MLQRTIDQKQMNITIVLGDKIPSIKYGGTQRVMWYLGKELDKRGHKVTFIAGKGSYCPFAKVIELDPAGNLNAQIPADTDLVHFNIPVPDGITKPHLLTIHGNGIPANADRNIVLSHATMRKDLEVNHSYTTDWTGTIMAPPISPSPERTITFWAKQPGRSKT